MLDDDVGGTGPGSGVVPVGGLTTLDVDGTIVSLVRGDVTSQEVDAIVNAANSSLMGGGGVDGAIHRAGGPEILEDCMSVVRGRGRLPAGEAVTTRAGRLRAKRVIHTVGPVWRGGAENEAEVLGRAYASSLQAAREEGLRKVAFPSISTGAYGYPVEEAAAVALAAVFKELESHPGIFDEIRFVLFDPRTFAAFEARLAVLSGRCS